MTSWLEVAACRNCGHRQFPVPLACGRCGNAQFDYVPAKLGTLGETTRVRNSEQRIALVMLDAGPVVIAQLLQPLEPGTQVEVTRDDVIGAREIRR